MSLASGGHWLDSATTLVVLIREDVYIGDASNVVRCV